MKNLFYLFTGLALFSCKKTQNLETELPGSWEMTYQKYHMQTYQGKSDSFTQEIDFSKDTKTPKIQVIYNLDGTFEFWQLPANGVPYDITTGNWRVKNDSLFLTYPTRDGNIIDTGFAITKSKNAYTAKNKYDWDNDQEIDDYLHIEFKRVEL